MKKLKLAKSWVPATSVSEGFVAATPTATTPTNPTATTLTNPSINFPSTIADPNDVAGVKARAMTLAPPIPSAGDTDTLSQILAYAKDPSVLFLLLAGGTGIGSAIILWKVGKWAWKKRFNKNRAVDLKSVAGQIDPKNIKRLDKALMKQNYQNYLIDKLYENKWLTKKEYKDIKQDITNKKFNIKFRSPDNIRKEFRTFVIACMRNDKISIKDFRRYSELSADEIEQFMKAKLKFKYTNKQRLTPDELAYEKYLEDIGGELNAKAIERKIKMNEPVTAAEKRALTLYNKNKASIISKFIR